MKKIIVFVLLCTFLTACGTKNSSQAAVQELKDCPVEHETEFGGVYIKIDIDSFNKLGFAYGDSVDVTFSNGYTMEDIPYYNGYYVDAGEPLLIAYPGYAYIKAAINYGEDLWERAGLNNKYLMAQKTLWKTAALEGNSTASVKMHEAGKYLDVQKARDISYSDERKKYPSDEVFANFRVMAVSGMKENVLYRGATPCDNQHNRAPYVDKQLEKAGIHTILNLCDTDAKIGGYIAKEGFESPYFRSLYQSGKVVPIGLNMNYLSEDFAKKIADGFTAISQMDAPYYIHCTEGKDRTGFICMVLEALAGASYEEIVNDYMVTYDNYYKITEEKDPARYKTIKEKNIDAMLQYIAGAEADIEKDALAPYAEEWLRHAGMSEEALQTLITKIRK